ncbi:hypothetical protein SAMN02745181_1075 [Rubritalea squalenifaciens DSM 18772]|uniref:Uncharacterized protein n=1 Tax=Rubritalea squalenifaciens DSM 18772 TaxID=1123071 RepID=A0A1M6EN76_9BACT|nr:hypothetical protein [Rubritalea squalenifaciens]SHI86914.1 hypothetical protein SAMN02745181_1075 [Rubritalea squalenifaciens DSM 18772]
MRETLTVIGIFLIGLALRSCRKPLFRKLGALVYLFTSGVAFYFISDSYWIAALGILVWFLLPWLELLTRVRKLRLPLNNRLSHRHPPSCQHFPEAEETLHTLEHAGFDHTTDAGWDWGSSTQFYRFFWHPEERTVAALCLCKQSNISFSFLTLTSRDKDGNIYRTSNYPFSQTLKSSPEVIWNNVGCKICSFEQLLTSHHDFIIATGLAISDLMMPDPDHTEQEVEDDMRKQIDHNLQKGIISLTGDGHFRYSMRGLFYLWKQYVRDMIRLC